VCATVAQPFGRRFHALTLVFFVRINFYPGAYSSFSTRKSRVQSWPSLRWSRQLLMKTRQPTCSRCTHRSQPSSESALPLPVFTPRCKPHRGGPRLTHYLTWLCATRPVCTWSISSSNVPQPPWVRIHSCSVLILSRSLSCIWRWPFAPAAHLRNTFLALVPVCDVWNCRLIVVITLSPPPPSPLI